MKRGMEGWRDGRMGRFDLVTALPGTIVLAVEEVLRLQHAARPRSGSGHCTAKEWRTRVWDRGWYPRVDE